MSLLSTIARQVIKAQSDEVPATPIDMNHVVTIILGGGEGKRLAPLTANRSKPAISFGGKYLLIDVPISNAINSGSKHIFVITQFLSTSLHQHIFKTYRPGNHSSAIVDLLSAEQGPDNRTWFKGTADAVRQNLNYLKETSAEYFLILSGDQLYNINFQHMVQCAKATNADMVIATLPVNEIDARRMGVMKLNEDRFITEFYEKPQDKAALEHMRLKKFTLKLFDESTRRKKQHLGSMGIYLFKREALFNLLQKDNREDFGKHLIPTMVAKGNVAAYLYDGYWEDIGTIESFYHANIGLTATNPAFDFYDAHNPIFSQQHYLPNPKILNTRLKNSIICEGSFVEADEVTNSILGLRSVVKQGTIIRNSYIMGNDFYNPPIRAEQLPTCLEIGEDCVIDHAIIDKNVHIGNGVRLINKKKIPEYESKYLSIRNGIIVIPRGTHIPDGFCI